MINRLLEIAGVPPEDSVMFFAFVGFILFILFVGDFARRRD